MNSNYYNQTTFYTKHVFNEVILAVVYEVWIKTVMFREKYQPGIGGRLAMPFYTATRGAGSGRDFL